MLALVLPLTLMAGCTSNEPPKPSPEGKVAPTPVEPKGDGGQVEAEPAYGVPITDEPKPSDVIDPEPEPIDRPADKYGAPPAPDGPDEPEDVIEPEPEIERRQPTKYGGPPRPRSPQEPL